MLICIKCGKPRNIGRRLCRECYLEQKRQQANARYLIKGRHMYKLVCLACQKSFIGWRKTQKLCSDCYKLKIILSQENGASNNYLYNTTGKPIHRIIVENILQKKLSFNQVVHHLDGNPKNNDLHNLIVLSRSKHGKLHIFLQYQRVILEKSSSENGVNCWNSLIVPITTTWLETAGVKVIKIWEIGQSAAKPPISGEGSETIHSTPRVGDDIVQTTTV